MKSRKSLETISEADPDVRGIRAALGFSQVDFATHIGVDPMQVSRWERGVSKPSRMARRALAGCRRRLERSGKLPAEGGAL